MRESLKARARNLSAVVERAMNGEAGSCASPVALADWVYEESYAIAEEAERDERSYWEAAQPGHPFPTQQP